MTLSNYLTKLSLRRILQGNYLWILAPRRHCRRVELEEKCHQKVGESHAEEKRCVFKPQKALLGFFIIDRVGDKCRECWSGERAASFAPEMKIFTVFFRAHLRAIKVSFRDDVTT